MQIQTILSHAELNSLMPIIFSTDFPFANPPKVRFWGIFLRNLKVKKWDNVGFYCQKGDNVG